MDYKLQQTTKNAKAMANKELKNITNEKLESLAKQERFSQKMLLIIIFSSSCLLLACGILSFIISWVSFGI